MSMRRRLFVSFGIGVVLMLGVTGLRSIARAQAPAAPVETGFCRAKNAAHTMAMNFMIYPIGLLGYWICGFALQFGGVGAVAALGGTAPLNSEFTLTLFGHPFGLFGTKGFFLGPDVYDVGVFAL